MTNIVTCNLDSDGCNSCALPLPGAPWPDHHLACPAYTCISTCTSSSRHIQHYLNSKAFQPLGLGIEQPKSNPTTFTWWSKATCDPVSCGSRCERRKGASRWCESLDKVMTANLLSLAKSCHQSASRRRVTLLTNPLFLTTLLVLAASAKATVLLLPSTSPELLTFEEPMPYGWTSTGFKLVNSSNLQDLEVRWVNSEHWTLNRDQICLSWLSS